jgi:hypothetical protein
MARPVVVVGGPTGPPGGPTGQTGPTGAEAATGPQGVQGPTGPIGTGPTGQQGHTGPEGTRGLTGPPGSLGSAGFTGPTGPVGATSTASTIFKDASLAGPYGPVGTGLTMIGLNLPHVVVSPATLGIEITGLVRSSVGGGGGGVTLSGRYSDVGSPPAAGETVDIGSPFSVVPQFFTSDAAGYYPFTVRMNAAFGTGTWWFDLAIASSSGLNAYVRDVYLTLIEY